MEQPFDVFGHQCNIADMVEQTIQSTIRTVPSVVFNSNSRPPMLMPPIRPLYVVDNRTPEEKYQFMTLLIVPRCEL